MPRPDKIWDLLDPSHPDFPFDGWDREFALYNWTYAAGFFEITELVAMKAYSPTLESNVAHPKVVHKIKQQLSAACEKVPGSWKKTVAGDGAEWSRCSPQQVAAAASSHPMRFDKMCIALIALELTVAELKLDIDIYDHIVLRPALYKLDKLNHSDRALLSNEGSRNAPIYADLLNHFVWADDDGQSINGRSAEQRAQAFLRNAMEGHAMTLATALEFQTFLRRHESNAVVRRIKNRTDDGNMSGSGKKKPNPSEPVHIKVKGHKSKYQLRGLTNRR